MVQLFNNSTDIILHEPAPFNEKIPISERRWILIPSIAYKVLIPEYKERKLNVFEETILKLFKSGNKDIKFLEDNLLINRKLIEYIINKLYKEKYIDKNNLVTEEGRNVLLDKNEDYKYIIGYIFFDVITNKFWDAFIPDVDYRIVENDGFGENFRRFKYGDLGNPTKVKATVVKSKNKVEIKNIDTLEIYEVCIKHKIRLSSINNINGNKNYILPKRIEKIRYLGEANPVYLATYMYYSKDLIKQSKWQVCYPFYGGTAINLRLELDKLKEMSENKGLREYIDDLVSTSLNVSCNQLEGFINEDEKNIYENLKKILSSNINNYPKVSKILLDINKNFQIVDRIKVNRGKRYDEIQEKLGENVVLAQEALEAALKVLATQYEGYYNDKVISYNRNDNIDMLSSLARQCGFEELFPNTFKKMFNLGKRKIESALISNEFKSLIALNLFIAQSVNEHSFFNLGKYVPGAIDFFYDLLNRRNENNHKYSVEDNERDIKVIYLRVVYIISLLFDDLTFNYKGKISFYEFDECDEKEVEHVDIKIKMQAEHDVEKDVGQEVRKYCDVKKLLISSKIKLIKGKGMCIVDFCKVFESLLNTIAERMLEKKAKNKVQVKCDENVDYIEKNIKKLGFNFKSEKLPKSFKRVSTNRIKNNFESFERGTLGSKIYTILYSAIENDSELIKQIGYEDPDLINLIAKITQIRQHYGSGIEFQDEFNDIYKKVAKSVNIILKNLANKELS